VDCPCGCPNLRAAPPDKPGQRRAVALDDSATTSPPSIFQQFTSKFRWKLEKFTTFHASSDLITRTQPNTQRQNGRDDSVLEGRRRSKRLPGASGLSGNKAQPPPSFVIPNSPLLNHTRGHLSLFSNFHNRKAHPHPRSGLHHGFYCLGGRHQNSMSQPDRTQVPSGL